MAVAPSKAVLLPSRPMDYLYDSNYTVSGRVDHEKAITNAISEKTKQVHNFASMFAALSRYRKAETVVIRSQNLHLGNDRRLVADNGHVSGADRSKYFKRPIMPYKSAMSGQIVYAKQQIQLFQTAVSRPASSFLKHVAIQTIYRESDTQTDPYSPEYIFEAGSEASPELLALATLTYGKGLPAGLAELGMIERARAKRQWELTLPVATDEASLKKRLIMMEEMELKEWSDREVEIHTLQEERLRVLQIVIDQREEDNNAAKDHRISAIWQRKMQDRQATFDKINKKRIKATRMIIDRRSKIENKLNRRDIIQEFGNYASVAYAPSLFKNSVPGDTLVMDPDIVPLSELNKMVDTSYTTTTINFPSTETNSKKSSKTIKEDKLQADLQVMIDKIQWRKTGNSDAQPDSRYSIKIERPPVRATTPHIDPPNEVDAEMNVAAIILQKIIRGRVIQEQMHLGKERKLNLIDEIRSRKNTTIKFQPSLEVSSPSLDALETIQSEYVSVKLDFLTKEIVRLREHQRLTLIANQADRTRRQRDAEESGRRIRALADSKKSDAIFSKIIGVYQHSVDSWLDDLISKSIDSISQVQALDKVLSGIQKMDKFRSDWQQSDEENVGDLVYSFLIPYVEKSVVRAEVERAQRKYLVAAHDAIHGCVNDLEKGVTQLDLDSELPSLPN